MDTLQRVLRVVVVVMVFGGGLVAGRYVWPRTMHGAAVESCKPVACIPAETGRVTPPKPHVTPPDPPPAESPNGEECCEKLLRGQTEKDRICYPKSYLEPGQKCMLRNGKILGEKPAEKSEKAVEAPAKAAEPAMDSEAATAKFQKENRKEIERVLKLFKEDYSLEVLSTDLPESAPKGQFACDAAGVNELTRFGEMFRRSPMNQGQAYFSESVEKIERVTKWLQDCVSEAAEAHDEPLMSQ